MTAPDLEGPQTLPVKFTCMGCKHLVTEYWKDYLDNDETDSGTSAKCAKADKHIASYWDSHNSPPSWCPCPRTTPLAEALAVPTDDQVASACLSYRHDFGLLDAKERAALMFQAREWLRAWKKEMPAALRAIGEGK